MTGRQNSKIAIKIRAKFWCRSD